MEINFVHFKFLIRFLFLLLKIYLLILWSITYYPALIMKSEIEITPEESAEPSLPILVKTVKSLPQDKKKTTVESEKMLGQAAPEKSVEIAPKKKSLEKTAESSSRIALKKAKEVVPKKKKITTRKTTEKSLMSMFGKDIEIVPLNEEGR